MLKQIIKDTVCRMWTGPIWLSGGSYNTATKLQDPYEAGNFMTRWATVRHGLCWCSSVPTRVRPSPVSRRREWSNRVVPWTACCGHRFPRELYGAPGNLCLSPNNKPAHKHEACQTAHQSPLKHKHHPEQFLILKRFSPSTKALDREQRSASRSTHCPPLSTG